MSAAEPTPTGRDLRLALVGSLTIAGLRFLLDFFSAHLGASAVSRVDSLLDLAGMATLAAIVTALLQLARRTELDAVRRVLRVALLCSALQLAIELSLWLIGAFGVSVWQLSEVALLAQLAWAVGRSALWLGLFAAASRRGRAPAAPLSALVPLASGLRALLFTATLLSPYLESGGRARQLFLETAGARSVLAWIALLLVDGALAWLTTRIMP